MAIIHLIGGEKGGVGKSVFARALIEFLQSKLESVGQPDWLIIIDADTQVPLIGKTYAPAYYGEIKQKNHKLEQYLEKLRLTRFSDDDDNFQYTNTIFDLAASARDVIVNLPANCFAQVENWLNKGDYLALGSEYEIEFWHWFVTDGGQESLDTLQESLRKFGSLMPHLLVKNWGLSDKEWDWYELESNEGLQKALKEKGVKTLDMPKLLLGSKYEQLKKKCGSLKAGIDDQVPGLTLTATEKQSLKIWRKQMFARLQELVEPSLKPEPLVTPQTEERGKRATSKDTGTQLSSLTG